MPPSFQRRQRGIALFVVIVFVLLSMLLALWASRTALFGEMVVGNDADYQRAFEAAQALLQDAEIDIRSADIVTSPATGKPVSVDGVDCSGSTDVCRKSTTDKIPLEPKAVGPLLSTLSNETTQCRNALCSKRSGRQDFWNYTSATSPAPSNLQAGEVPLEQMTATGIGARYGQYTGATINSNSNPILGDRSANNQGGWYWIEILPYDETSKNSNVVVGGATNLLPLNMTPNVVYRITALAYGRKPGTMVVLQQTYARQVAKD